MSSSPRIPAGPNARLNRVRRLRRRPRRARRTRRHLQRARSPGTGTASDDTRPTGARELRVTW
ncbi:hypothetical protein AB0395_31250 [Streptosporangium sp. NPDC051023]|uniref:hypothetical protein n=1 Tax=Streptosporangium sp. NPDC051023 TaxID=3155410 RepID=UPI00344D801A